MEHECHGKELSLVKNLALKQYHAAAAALFEFSPLKVRVIEELERQMKREMKAYSQDKSACFRYKDDLESLVNYRGDDLLKEAKLKLPLTYGIVSNTTRAKAKELIGKRVLAISSLLNTWIPKSMFSYRNNILLTAAGCKSGEIECFQKMGISSHQNTLRNLQTKLGENFDEQVVQWKFLYEQNKLKSMFIVEVLETQLGDPREEADMDICTITLQKDVVSIYSNYSAEIYDLCVLMFPPSVDLIFDESDLLAAVDLLRKERITKYR